LGLGLVLRWKKQKACDGAKALFVAKHGIGYSSPQSEFGPALKSCRQALLWEET
jgi:hypothetical protein